MNWRTKVLVQNLVGVLPGRLPFWLNELATRRVRGRTLDRFDVGARVVKGLDNLDFMARTTGAVVEGRTVLEFGTGWHGVDLVLFHLLGARRVHTVDHHRHLRPAVVRDVVMALVSRADCREPILASGLSGRDVVESRMAELLAWAKGADPDGWADLLSVHYHVRTNAVPDRLPIDAGSVGLFYSESVLQRIPESALRRSLGYVADHLMSSDSVFFHRINPMDVNAHLDGRLWYFDYLRHGEFFFRYAYSGKLNRQNRLRESDFLQLFAEAGLCVERIESHLVPADVERLSRFAVAPRFRAKAPEDLAVFRSRIAGRRCAGARPASPPTRDVHATRGYSACD